MNESKKYDCFRGCVVVDYEDGSTECTYREGCCKLAVHNYLKDIPAVEHSDIFEVRFKNTRKAYYRNESGQSIRQGDKVVVEVANNSGYDLGIVSLEGPLVLKQLERRKIDPESYEFKKILRKARQADIDKWIAATAREHKTMIEARRIAATLGLDMKIGDVEFQGDGSKAIFYYIADGRVDFRQLIKVFAEEFRIKIEMKQIGARQEAGRIGGIGPCGRELCCATWMTNFSSVSTAAARFQDISLNPQKLAGQCAKLKCCMNYEVDQYMESLKKLPSREITLHTQDEEYFFFKADILAHMVTYSTDKKMLVNEKTISARRAFEVIQMNRNGQKPASLNEEEHKVAPVSVDLLDQDNINRFDSHNKRHKKKKKKRSNNSNGTNSVG